MAYILLWNWPSEVPGLMKYLGIPKRIILDMVEYLGMPRRIALDMVEDIVHKEECYLVT